MLTLLGFSVIDGSSLVIVPVIVHTGQGLLRPHAIPRKSRGERLLRQTVFDALGAFIDVESACVSESYVCDLSRSLADLSPPGGLLDLTGSGVLSACEKPFATWSNAPGRGFSRIRCDSGEFRSSISATRWIGLRARPGDPSSLVDPLLSCTTRVTLCGRFYARMRTQLIREIRAGECQSPGQRVLNSHKVFCSKVPIFTRVAVCPAQNAKIRPLQTSQRANTVVPHGNSRYAANYYI